MAKVEAPKRIVLDTNVVVRHLRGRHHDSILINTLQENSDLATTIVNAFELYYGAYRSRDVRSNLNAAKGFLATLSVLDFDDRSAELSGQVIAKLECQGIAIDPRDAFSGCIALVNGYSMLTFNRKHFERIPNLLVLDAEVMLSNFGET